MERWIFGSCFEARLIWSRITSQRLQSVPVYMVSLIGCPDSRLSVGSILMLLLYVQFGEKERKYEGGRVRRRMFAVRAQGFGFRNSKDERMRIPILAGQVRVGPLLILHHPPPSKAIHPRTKLCQTLPLHLLLRLQRH